MFRVYEVITRKEVSIVFDDGDITAGLPKDTQGVLLPEGSSGHLLEYLHLDSLDILAHPLIEDDAEKIAQSFSWHSTVAKATFFVWPRLDQGQKRHIFGLNLLEEPVNLDGMLGILCMHHTQYIARDSVLPQELIPTHRLLVGGVLALGDAILIVHFLGTVQAKPNNKTLGLQKVTPLFIEESTVGLHTVGDALVRGLMLALQRRNLAKVVQPQDGRFPAMPGKVDHRTGGSGNVLYNVLLQDVVGHAKRLALWIEVFLLQVVTIVTVKVTDGTTGLGKNLKFAGGFDHCSIPSLWVERHKALDLI